MKGMDPARTRGERAVIATVLACSAAMLLWMGRALLTGEIPFTGDLLHFHYPLRDFYAGALAAGQRFDWMPSLFNGFYVVGEGQLGAYHPLHWLLYRFLPLDRAFALEMVAAYPFMFAGAWLFLRRWCAAAPAAFGAMLATFSAFGLSHGVHPNMITVVSHVPWLLLAIDAATAPAWRARTAGAAALGLLIGSQLLIGHPQAVWLSGLVVAAYAAMQVTAPSPAPRARRIAAVAAGTALGAAIGAVQLLATLHAARSSIRAEADASFATTFSLAPIHLFQLIEPYAFWGRTLRWTEVAGDEFAAYGGAVTLTLAVWWLAARGGRRHGATTRVDRFGRGAAVFGVVGLWLATGSHGKLYLLQTWLPIVGQFRVPARFVLWTQLALAAIAAIAMARLLERPRSRNGAATPRALWAPWALAAASTAAAVWLTARGTVPVSGMAATIAIMAGPVLFVAASGLLTIAIRGARWAVLGLALLAAFDHALYGLGGVLAWQDFLTRQEAVALLDTPEAVRAERGRLAHGGFPDLYLLDGYSFVDGYLGLIPARRLDYHAPAALRVAHAAYANAAFLEPAPLPDVRPVGNGWYELPPPLPRARLVSESRVSTHPAGDLSRIDVARVALATRDLGLRGGPPGVARLVEDDPGALRIDTQAPSRQLLVVSESFDEGWRAAVDGVPTDVERIYGDFLGVVIPAGRHQVALDFLPAHLAAGRLISAGALAVAVALLAASRWRWRGSGPA